MNSNRLRTICILLCSFALLSVAGCTEGQRKDLKHFKSDVIGLKRRVTLFDNNGRPIRTWEGRFKVEIVGGFASFIDDNGKDVKVSGSVVIEEF